MLPIYPWMTPFGKKTIFSYSWSQSTKQPQRLIGVCGFESRHVTIIYKSIVGFISPYYWDAAQIIKTIYNSMHMCLLDKANQ